MSEFKDPTAYAGQQLCPRCGSGYPNCADRVDGIRKYAHDKTCAIYNWSDYTCGRCSLELALDNDSLRSSGFSDNP